MAGTWESQNKILPGVYINIRTNEPLSITPGDRGITVILQELSAGVDEEMYTITATEPNYPEGAVAADKKLAAEALKKAKTVILCKLPDIHDGGVVERMLEKLKTVDFHTLCYPYDEKQDANKARIASWIRAMREDEGKKCQAVLANYDADHEGIINVSQGIVLSGNEMLTAAEVTAWVAGATAGARITASNTGMKYEGAIDVMPRLTRSEQEAAVSAGRFIFKTDSAQNVTVVYDINSMLSVTEEKSKAFTKNRVIRTIDNIANDLASIFEANYLGKVNNNEIGRSRLKAIFVDYFAILQNMEAIQEFSPDDIEVAAGADVDAVTVNCNIQLVDSVEKIYISVNLS